MLVVLLTNDAANRRKAKEEGLTAMGPLAYVRAHRQDAKQLLDLVAAPQVTACFLCVMFMQTVFAGCVALCIALPLLCALCLPLWCVWPPGGWFVWRQVRRLLRCRRIMVKNSAEAGIQAAAWGSRVIMHTSRSLTLVWHLLGAAPTWVGRGIKCATSLHVCARPWVQLLGLAVAWESQSLADILICLLHLII